MSKKKNLFKIKKPKNLNTIFGLPAKSYTDENFWKKECDTVLSEGWLFVGFVHEFKKIGDVFPLNIANKPPTLKPIKQPIAVSKNVTPIAFPKKIIFHIVKKLGISSNSLSIIELSSF